MAQGREVSGEQIEKLLDGLRLGMTRRAASGYAGFSKTTLYRMLEHDDGTLVTAIERAEAEAESTFSALVARAASVDAKNWTAAAWWLERRHPDEFGRRDRVEVTVNTKELAQKIAGDLDADVVLAEAERILAETR